MMQLPYRAVFMDVGETLTYPHPSFHGVVVRILARHGVNVTEADVELAEPRVWHEMEARRNRGDSYALTGLEARRYWEDAYALLVRELGIPDEENLSRRICDEFVRVETWRLYPDALPALLELRGSGLTMGIVSNWEDWLEDLLLYLDVRKLFDFVIFSSQDGVAKPDPRLYQRALEAASVDPSQAVHVGDDPVRDVDPARSLGITPVLIDRHNRYPHLDVLRITDLRQLPALLAAPR